MIREVKGTELSNMAYLFSHWEETMIWSCLQGMYGKSVCSRGERKQICHDYNC